MDRLVTSIFDLSKDVRYVAVYDGTDLTSRSRPGQTPSSDGDSDTYEELLVNPTLLLLTKQRGNIDCGGLRHVLVGYGHFGQLVVPLDKGHISICLELGANYDQLQRNLAPLIGAWNSRHAKD